MFYSNFHPIRKSLISNGARKTIALILGVLAMAFLIGYFVFAWEEPKETPPGGNVPAPINEGDREQVKSGRLGIGVKDADDNYMLTIGTKGLKITNTSSNPSLYVEDESNDKTPFIIDKYGKVGIGTTNPSEKLDVAGNIHATGDICTDSQCLNSVSGGGVSGSGTTNYLAKWTGSTSLGNSQIYDNGAKVGIGTTNPSYKLEVAGSVKITDGSLAVGGDPLSGVGIRSKKTGGGAIGVRGDSDAGYGVLGHGIQGTVGEGKFGIVGHALSGKYSNAIGVYGDCTGTTYESSCYAAKFKGGKGVDIKGNTYISGKVGIGTTSPKDKLEVAGGIRVDDYIRARDSGGLALKTDEGTTRLFIKDNGNVGIGTTDPSEKLDVAGNIHATGDICTDSQCLNSVSGGGVSGSGTTNYLAKWTGSTSLGNSVIYDTGTKVGIGTTAPANKLHVAGDARINTNLGVGTAPSTSYRIYSSGGSYGIRADGSTMGGYFRDSDGTSYAYVANAGYGILGYGDTMGGYFYDRQGTSYAYVAYGSYGIKGYGNTAGGYFYDKNRTSRVYLAYGNYDVYANLGSKNYFAGKVGIGTTSPNDKLEVAGGIRVDDYIRARDSGGLALKTDEGTTRLFIKDNGRVGIGTTNPQETLHVYGTVNIGYHGATSGRVYIYEPGSDTALFVRNQGGGVIAHFLASGGASRMIIKQDGKVGIGTTSPKDKLEVAGGIRVDDYIRARDSGGLALKTDEGTTRLFIKDNGKVGIGTTNPQKTLHVNGDIRANKLTVTTIDPVYEIDGKEYATYVSDFAGGVRIETSGVIKLKDGYKFVIDFDRLEKGSDLWLFWQASNKNINDLAVLLTPGFDGKVWYQKEGNKLIIQGNQRGEVSYRLTLPRKDYQDWPNEVK